MKQQRFRRKKKIIKPGYQLKFAFFVVLFLLIYSIILGTAIFFPLAMEMQTSTNSDDQARVAFVILGLHERLWPALVAILALAFAGAILYSHRIAGPLYRLEKTVEEFMKGDFSKRVRLRKTDELQEIETSLNRLAEHLEKVRSVDAAFRVHMRERLSSLRGTLASGDRAAREAMEKNLNDLVDELTARPDAFWSGLT